MKKITGNNNDWYNRWFSSPYYHVLYKHRDDSEAKKFISNLVRYLKLKKGSKLLDLACGRGRHSFYLAKKGFRVTGVDLSEENISYASPPVPLSKKRGGEKNLPSFFVHDMRKVFKKNYFDVVLNLFTSFGYFDDENDDRKVLNAINVALKKEGIFVLDFMNVKRITAGLRPEEIKVIDDVKFEISRSVKKGFITKKIKVDLTPRPHPPAPSPKGEGEKKKYSVPISKALFFEERVSALTLEDFKKYFSETGFEIIEIFGNYDLSNFDEKKSERLILIAKKNVTIQSSGEDAPQLQKKITKKNATDCTNFHRLK